MSNSVSPDVDLKSRGLPTQLILGVGVLGLALLFSSYYHGASSGDSAQADGEEESLLWLLWLLLFVIKRLFQMALFLAFCLLVMLIVRQRSIIYVPVPPGMKKFTKENPHGYVSPKDRGLPYEDLYFVTEDGVRVNAWLVYQPLSALKDDEVPYTFVYFHGNAGNIGHLMDNLKDMHMRLRINILVLDYRAYGESEDGPGPSEHGFLKDAMATYRWLVDWTRDPPPRAPTRMSVERTFLFGRSIGGAVAFRLFGILLKERVHAKSAGSSNAMPLPAGVIVENTFTSLRDMAVTVFPFLAFLRPLLRYPLVLDEWRSAESLEYILQHHQNWCCCLFGGMKDQIVPPKQMEQIAGILRAKRPTVFKYFTINNGGHNDTPTVGGAEYWECFKKFMLEVASTEADRREGLMQAGIGPAR